MNTGKAVQQLSKALKEDKELYVAYQANIAMSFVDNCRWYKEKTGKKVLSKEDIFKIANQSADYFLQELFIKN